MSMMLGRRALRRRVSGPALIYSFDFENGNAGNVGWDAASSTIVTSPTLGGTQAARVVGGTAGWGFQYPLGAVRTELYHRQKVRIDMSSNPSTEVWLALIRFGDGSSWPFIFNSRLRANGTVGLVMWNTASGSEIGSTADLPKGQTIDLEIYIKVATSGGRIWVRANGATIINFTGNTGTTGFDTVSNLAYDTNLFGAVVTHYFDDLIGALTGWPQYGSGGGTVTPPATGDNAFVTMNVKAMGISQGRGATERDGTAGLNDLVTIGAQMLRTDVFFDNVQPTQGGAYVWGPTDTLVNNARSRGLFLLLILNGPRAGSNWLYTNSADRAAFGDFCAAVVTRYIGQVEHFAIINEPNLDKMLPENYTLLIQNAYPKMKAANPNCFVLGHNLAGAVGATDAGIPMTSVQDWMTRTYAAGIKGYYDAVGTHPYTWPFQPDPNTDWNGWWITINRVRAAMVANGESGLTVWVTEYGAPTQGLAGPPAASETNQMNNIDNFVAAANAMDWIGPIFIYERIDQGGSNAEGSTENWFGLRRPDGSAKPALARFTFHANAYPRLTLK